MEKIKVNREIAEAFEKALSERNNDEIQLLADHFNDNIEGVLKDFSKIELCEIVNNGYEIKRSV